MWKNEPKLAREWSDKYGVPKDLIKKKGLKEKIEDRRKGGS